MKRNMRISSEEVIICKYSTTLLHVSIVLHTENDSNASDQFSNQKI